MRERIDTAAGAGMNPPRPVCEDGIKVDVSLTAVNPEKICRTSDEATSCPKRQDGTPKCPGGCETQDPLARRPDESRRRNECGADIERYRWRPAGVGQRD